MAETSDMLITMSDEQMITSYLNNAWSELTGVSVENLLRFGWVGLLHPDDKNDFLSHYLTALTSTYTLPASSESAAGMMITAGCTRNARHATTLMVPL